MKDISKERVDLVFSSGALTAADVAARTLEFLDIKNTVNLYGKSIGVPKALTAIEKSNKPNFNIDSQHYLVHFSTLKSYGLQLLSITGKNLCTIEFWRSLVDLYSGENGFVQACVINENYSYWQNAQDPLQYEAAGKSTDSLKFTSNELPAPLNQVIIDISSNAGRILINPGYIEMIGNAMWFGAKFPYFINTRKIYSVFENLDGIVVEKEKGVARIVVGESSFDENTPKELQEKLRDAIYG